MGFFERREEMKRRLGIVGILIIAISLFYGCAVMRLTQS
jgi:hypothetical protein